MSTKQEIIKYKELRDKQEKEANRRFKWTDLLILALPILLFRTVSVEMKQKIRSTTSISFLIYLIYVIIKGKAPNKSIQHHSDVFSWPFIGQIGQIINVLRKGIVGNQLERARIRDFKTSEVVLFGPIRDIGLMEAKDIEYFLKTNWKNFPKNVDDPSSTVGFQELFAPIMGRGIFTVDGEEWQYHRKISSYLFSGNALKYQMENCFCKHSRRLVELMKKSYKNGDVIDIQDIMQAFTFETICEIAFGAEPAALENAIVNQKKIDFLIRFDRAQNLCLNRLIIPTFLWKLFRYFDITYEKQLSEDSRELRKYVQSIIEVRRHHHHSGKNGEEEEEEDKNDILALYMKQGNDFDDELLQDTVLNIMIAGRDTTSSTLINVFRLLSNHENVIEKMLKEFDSAGVTKKNFVSWDDIPNLPYNGAVFNEVLRLHPPVPGDFRVCLETCEFPSGVIAPKGCRVSLPIAAIGRSSKLWDKPDEFIPDRWLTSNGPTKRPDEFLLPVFWGGPRACLGKDAARLEVISTCYTILSSGLRFELLPNQSEKIKIGPVQFYEEGVKMKIRQI